MALAQKTVLVTGSTDGIGKETALELSRRSLRVIVHGRSPARVEAAREEIARLVPRASLEGWPCDLSSLAEVRAHAPTLLTLAPSLDVLVLNAGLYQESRKVSADGFELTFAVSHLAHFLLARLLLPVLRAAAPARVVVVSSQVHQRAHLDLQDLQMEKRYSAYGAYGQAKLCNVLFAKGLAARFSPEILTANSLHPGVVGTKLLRGFGMQGGPDSLAEGAATSVFLATSPAVAQTSGRYFVRSRESTTNPEADSVELREALWKRSEALTGTTWDEQPANGGSLA